MDVGMFQMLKRMQGASCGCVPEQRGALGQVFCAIHDCALMGGNEWAAYCPKAVQEELEEETIATK